MPSCSQLTKFSFALIPPGEKIRDLSILYSLVDISHHMQSAFKQPLQLRDP